MRVLKSNLRRRAESGPGSQNRDRRRRGPDESSFGAAVRWVLSGGATRNAPGSELDQMAFPDLLAPGTRPILDRGPLENMLDLAFLGRASAGELDRILESMPSGDTRWNPAHFRDDLFLPELVKNSFKIEIGGKQLAVYRRFIERVLVHPPTDPATIRYRQGILRELEEQPVLGAAAERLLLEMTHLLSLLRASRDDARLEPVRFRLDVLRSFQGIVEHMVSGFSNAGSALGRVHEAGLEIRNSAAFQRMTALLDHQASMATLRIDAVIGADGKPRHLEISGIRECKSNPFYRRPLRRWWDRVRIVFRRYRLDPQELVDRLVMAAYQEIAPALTLVVQLQCHLQLYLAARTFAASARGVGLEVCLPEIGQGGGLTLEGLFNPLLMVMADQPVPSDIAVTVDAPVVLITGPNSGGKTRLLQAVGIAQVLGQSGLYCPCVSAKLPIVGGLFASIVEVDRADQGEGRLGTELVRLRTLFESVPPGSLVLLDELCSGTNPSEAIEIVEMVLSLLRRLEPIGFVSTHFLDFAHQLRAQTGMNGNGLEFLQAEVDGAVGPTYRFIPGVASTSLAVGTARRLGVTFEELERRLDQRCKKG